MRSYLSITTAAWIIILTLVYSSSAHAGGYGGYYYGSHYGYRHYGHHGNYYGNHGYGHYGHYGYHRGPYYVYRHSGYYSPGYYHERNHSTHGHSPLYTLLTLPAHLAYGILKAPAVIVDSLTRPYSSGSNTPGDNSHGHSSGAGNVSSQPGETENNQPAKEEGARIMDSTGWDDLAQGRYRDALHSFGNLAQANPDKGAPKAGYALAAAAVGDLDRGIWAMKRALLFDADSLNYLQVDMNLESTLAELISRYQVRMDNRQDADSGLMLASLYYLSGDLNAARQTIELTRQYGHSDNLARLGDLISQHEN